MPSADLCAVALRGLVKTYQDRTVLHELDLDLPSGRCLGLLGPNGAGKSTLLGIITGRVRPDAGEVTVLGRPVPARAQEVRSMLGVVPQHDDLDDELTAREHLEVFARLAGMSRGEVADATDQALLATRLTDRGDTRIDELSGGMRRRLQIARALLRRPFLLLLDEPTVGLDPQIRQELWDLVDELRSHGTTVLLTTHYIEEAERLADEVVVLLRGRVIARGAPQALLTEHVGTTAFEYTGTPGRRTEITTAAQAAGLPTRRTGTTVSVLRAEDMPARLATELGPPRVRRPTSLEDVFVALTGESLT